MTSIDVSAEVTLDFDENLAENLAEEIAGILDDEPCVSSARVSVHDGRSRPYNWEK